MPNRGHGLIEKNRDLVDGERELENVKKEILDYSSKLNALKRDHEFEMKTLNRNLNLMKESKR